MGLINKINSEKKIQPIGKMYSDHLTIERTENFHIHMRNLRIELDKNEYRLVSLGSIFGFFKWIVTGCKNRTPGENQFLFKGKLPRTPSIINGFTTSDELRVELQQWADFVHIHYKNIRLEFTLDEAVEFLTVMEDGLNSLKEAQKDKDRVKRIGLDHRAVPSIGLLEGDSENSEFWVDWKQAEHLKNPFLTTKVGEESGAVEEAHRKDGENNIFGFSIDDLYDQTLYVNTDRKVHGFKDGIFLPLQYRYNFAKELLDKGKNFTDEEIKESEYYKLLTQQFGTFPRDGSPDLIYKDPIGQARRFEGLINSLSKGSLGDQNAINDYKNEFGLADFLYESGKSHQHEGSLKIDSEEIIIMTCYAYKTGIHVKDGLHRLAALKAIKDHGVDIQDNINCLLVNPHKIYGNSFRYLSSILMENMATLAKGGLRRLKIIR